MPENYEMLETSSIRGILKHYKKEDFFINKTDDEVEIDVVLVQGLIEKFFRNNCAIICSYFCSDSISN